MSACHEGVEVVGYGGVLLHPFVKGVCGVGGVLERCLRGCEWVFVAVLLEEVGEFDCGWEAIETRMCLVG